MNLNDPFITLTIFHAICIGTSLLILLIVLFVLIYRQYRRHPEKVIPTSLI